MKKKGKEGGGCRLGAGQPGREVLAGRKRAAGPLPVATRRARGVSSGEGSEGERGGGDETGAGLWGRLLPPRTAGTGPRCGGRGGIRQPPAPQAASRSPALLYFIVLYFI